MCNTHTHNFIHTYIHTYMHTYILICIHIIRPPGLPWYAASPHAATMPPTSTPERPHVHIHELPSYHGRRPQWISSGEGWHNTASPSLGVSGELERAYGEGRGTLMRARIRHWDCGTRTHQYIYICIYTHA